MYICILFLSFSSFNSVMFPRILWCNQNLILCSFFLVHCYNELIEGIFRRSSFVFWASFFWLLLLFVFFLIFVYVVQKLFSNSKRKERKMNTKFVFVLFPFYFAFILYSRTFFVFDGGGNK